MQTKGIYTTRILSLPTEESREIVKFDLNVDKRDILKTDSCYLEECHEITFSNGNKFVRNFKYKVLPSKVNMIRTNNDNVQLTLKKRSTGIAKYYIKDSKLYVNVEHGRIPIDVPPEPMGKEERRKPRRKRILKEDKEWKPSGHIKKTAKENIKERTLRKSTEMKRRTNNVKMNDHVFAIMGMK
jgi:hypothetical protein